VRLLQRREQSLRLQVLWAQLLLLPVPAAKLRLRWQGSSAPVAPQQQQQPRVLARTANTLPRSQWALLPVLLLLLLQPIQVKAPRRVHPPGAAVPKPKEQSAMVRMAARAPQQQQQRRRRNFSLDQHCGLLRPWALLLLHR
jgi:hypothetical protein